MTQRVCFHTVFDDNRVGSADRRCITCMQSSHAAPAQVNLAPLSAQLKALEVTPPAQISPALDDLYALLGRPVDAAAAGEAEALVLEVLGATLLAHSYAMLSSTHQGPDRVH